MKIKTIISKVTRVLRKPVSKALGFCSLMVGNGLSVMFFINQPFDQASEALGAMFQNHPELKDALQWDNKNCENLAYDLLGKQIYFYFSWLSFAAGVGFTQLGLLINPMLRSVYHDKALVNLSMLIPNIIFSGLAMVFGALVIHGENLSQDKAYQVAAKHVGDTVCTLEQQGYNISKNAAWWDVLLPMSVNIIVALATLAYVCYKKPAAQLHQRQHSMPELLVRDGLEGRLAANYYGSFTSSNGRGFPGFQENSENNQEGVSYTSLNP